MAARASEPECQPVSIGTILIPPRQLDSLSGDPLQTELQEWPIMHFEQPVRDVNLVIGVDPDQVGFEGRMVDLR